MVPVDDREALIGYYGLALVEMADELFAGQPSRMAAWLHGCFAAVAIIGAGPELLPVYCGIEPWWLVSLGQEPREPDHGKRLLERLQETVEQLRQQRAEVQEA